ncbi:MAG: YegS/Rv2252/BmrU family lipid kinase [Geobacteraceae bacterium]
MAKRCFLIVNPTAGRFSRQKIEQVISILQQYGFDTELLLTAKADDATIFARRICAEEAEPFIVAGGGDGTVNDVVNSLLPGRATLGLLPFGTANVLASELNISSMEKAMQRLVRGETRQLSAGMLEWQGKRKYFLLMVGIGLDGAVVEEVRLPEKKIIGKGAYILSALRQLTAWNQELFTIRADGIDMECHSAVICNGRKYGGDFVMAASADIFSPGFHVLCVKDAKRRSYVKLVFGMLAGRLPQDGSVAMFPARVLEISGSKAVQVDGDYYCHAPVRITAVENFARIIS